MKSRARCQRRWSGRRSRTPILGQVSRWPNTEKLAHDDRYTKARCLATHCPCAGTIVWVKDADAEVGVLSVQHRVTDGVVGDAVVLEPVKKPRLPLRFLAGRRP